MDMTGWLQGQVFLQTVDEAEVEAVRTFLTERGLAFQVLTLSERLVLDENHPEASVASDRFSVAIQIGGFPQVLAPVLTDLVRRVHGGGWDPAEPDGGPASPPDEPPMV